MSEIKTLKRKNIEAEELETRELRELIRQLISDCVDINRGE